MPGSRLSVTLGNNIGRNCKLAVVSIISTENQNNPKLMHNSITGNSSFPSPHAVTTHLRLAGKTTRIRSLLRGARASDSQLYSNSLGLHRSSSAIPGPHSVSAVVPSNPLQKMQKQNNHHELAPSTASKHCCVRVTSVPKLLP